MVDQNSQFYAILTKVGAAKQANADALGIPWKITHMAVGDASPAGLDNPALPMPDASWTSLLNEWRRAPLNQLKVDDAAKIVGCWKALSKQGLAENLVGDSDAMRRAVAFCQVIEPAKNPKYHKVSSKNIADMFQKVVEAYQEHEREQAGREQGQKTHARGFADA